MTFVAGALLGLALGSSVAIVIARRRSVAIPVALAVIALVIAAIALSRRDRTVRVAVPTSTTRVPPTSTTATTRPRATVIVPNVVGETREAAVAALTKLGLPAGIDAIPLPNVPSGFVLSQNPIAASEVAPGTPVSLVISGAT